MLAGWRLAGSLLAAGLRPAGWRLAGGRLAAGWLVVDADFNVENFRVSNTKCLMIKKLTNSCFTF